MPGPRIRVGRGHDIGLTNAVLDRKLPDSVKRSSDVRRALSQNEAIEGKVQEAAEELQLVTDLLRRRSPSANGWSGNWPAGLPPDAVYLWTPRPTRR